MINTIKDLYLSLLELGFALTAVYLVFNDQVTNALLCLICGLLFELIGKAEEYGR